MSTLKMQTKTYHTVNYGDLENFIRKATGHEYEIPSQEETNNDCALTHSVTGFISAYDIQCRKPDWDKFKKTGNGARILNVILNGLAEEDLIPKGEYIVKVSW